MRLLLFTTAIIIAVSADEVSEWNRYKEEYNKVYSSELENVRRLQQYLKTKEMVEEHNRRYERGETSYTMGINKFSDWFPEEFNNILGLAGDESTSGGMKFEPPPGTRVPDSINWVEKGAVTSVKDQRNCRSSYAFAAIGSMEGLMFVRNNTITDLSPQQLVDCSSNSGCKGGVLGVSFLEIELGITSEQSYPYEAERKACREEFSSPVTNCSGFAIVGTERDLNTAVGTKGPVSIYFAVDGSFISYKGGIFNGPCASVTNHAMLVVGYGKDEITRQEYWLVKNSWGAKWGEKGYARVLKMANTCGLGETSMFPIHNE